MPSINSSNLIKCQLDKTLVSGHSYSDAQDAINAWFHDPSCLFYGMLEPNTRIHPHGTGINIDDSDANSLHDFARLFREKVYYKKTYKIWGYSYFYKKPTKEERTNKNDVIRKGGYVTFIIFYSDLNCAYASRPLIGVSQYDNTASTAFRNAANAGYGIGCGKTRGQIVEGSTFITN